MIYSFKDTDYKTFTEGLDNLSIRTFKIDKTNRGKLEKTTNLVKEWENDIKSFLNRSIEPDASFFEEIVDQDDKSIFANFRIHSDNTDPFEREIKRLERRIRRNKNNIQAIKKYIEICYPLNGKELPEISGVQEKLDFTLEILNLLSDDEHYSIETIFKLNNIDFRNGEPAEIAVALSKKKYVSKKEQYLPSDDAVRITVSGSTYIERKIKARSKNKEKNKKDSNLSDRIDQIIEKLTKLGYGQEIIFEELEEMREMQGKLSKKSWGQLLKGKLIDLAVGQVINKEVASDVFKFLTNEGMKLLK